MAQQGWKAALTKCLPDRLNASKTFWHVVADKMPPIRYFVLNGDKIVVNKVENKEMVAETRKANKTPTTTISGKSDLGNLSKMVERKAPKEEAPPPKFTINVKNRWADLKEAEDTAVEENDDEGDCDFFWEAPDAEMREEQQLLREAEQTLFPDVQKIDHHAPKQFSMSSDSEEDPEIAELTALIAMTEAQTKGLEQNIKDISEKMKPSKKELLHKHKHCMRYLPN